MANATDIVSPEGYISGRSVDESTATVRLVMIAFDLSSVVLRLPTLASRLLF